VTNPDLAALLPPIEAIDALSPEQLPGLVAGLAALQARAAARLAAAPASAGNGTTDRMLGIANAAARTGMSASWLYRHHASLPFARRIGRKLVFSEVGLTRWLTSRPR
jgi:predicted DNA-binding transcriptional regulator AlpA